jgi:hypothetical protein
MEMRGGRYLLVSRLALGASLVQALLFALANPCPCLADNLVTKVVRGVAKGAETVVVDTAKGAGVVVKSAGHVGEVVVQDAAKGTGTVVRSAGHAVGIGNGDAVPYTPPANGNTVVNAAAPVAPAVSAAAAPTARPSLANIGKAPKSPPPSTLALIGTTLGVAIDGAGNIVDTNGRLVGRVLASSTDAAGQAVDLGGQTLSVSVNAAGEMVDGSGRIVGHILGAPGRPAQPSAGLAAPATTGTTTTTGSSWNDESALNDAAGKLHGPLQSK